MNILLIEDNISIIKGLIYAFKDSGYNLIYKSSIKDASTYLINGKPDLIILDIMLPDGSGFNLYEKMVKPLNIPTIFLTAKDDEESIIKGLNEAEDYMTKPFNKTELIVKVNRILSKNRIIRVKNISFDMNKMILTKSNKEVKLTALELKLVDLLFININKVVTRESILDKIWEWTGNYVDDHTITVYFNRIRDKLGDNIIKTIKGVGYRIDGE